MCVDVQTTEETNENDDVDRHHKQMHKTECMETDFTERCKKQMKNETNISTLHKNCEQLSNKIDQADV